MAKVSRSIGVDDATGQPASAPEGPYITDRTDDSRQRKPVRDRERSLPDRSPPERRNDQPSDPASRRKGPAQP